MWNRILTPLDGSTLAERALPVAARMAHATGARLLLLRIYPCLLGEAAPELVASSETADAREARAYLTRIRQRSELEGLDVEELTLCGAPARTILDAIEAFHADSVVMSSHGRSGVSRWMLGSVAEHVARHAGVPILVLRGDQTVEQATAGGALRACVGLDGSAFAEQVIEPTAQLLRALAGSAQAEMLFVRVMKPPTSPDDELAAIAPESPAAYERRVMEAQANLEAAAERLRSGDLARYAVRPRWAVIQAVDAADALLQAAEHPEWVQWRPVDSAEPAPAPGQDTRARLLAVATHGRGGLQRWALGSVAAHVLEGTSLPLLLVRTQPAPDAQSAQPPLIVR